MYSIHIYIERETENVYTIGNSLPKVNIEKYLSYYQTTGI